MKDVMFITWEKHQRTRSFCEKLSINLFELVSANRGMARYVENLKKTFGLLVANKPKVLFVQNPSIVLAAFVVCLKPFLGYRLIVDAHNQAIIPFVHDKWIIRVISRWVIRCSQATIVTNSMLAEKVISYGGNPIVFPDLLPNVACRKALTMPSAGEPFLVTLISTYAKDEPYEEVFQAISALGSTFRMCVTGKVPASLDRQKIPANVELMGFLSHSEYWELLYRSHLVIDLSTMQNCLVCGAYESLAIEKPMLLSANPASISLFGDYAEHVSNSSDAIQSGIKKIVADYDELATKIALAKQQFLLREQQAIKEMVQYISNPE